jgi:protein TonB
MPWQPQGQGRDRTKALALVAVLHLALGAALITGLAGEPLRRSVEALNTFDVPLPEPPPPPPPPISQQDAAAEREAGAPDLDARPAPVVQPKPEVRLPVPPTLPTADETAPVTAAAPSAGAGREAGPGRGAGGSGDGTGGGGPGGSGTGGGLGSGARLLSGNLSRGDYRRIRGYGAPRGSAVLALDISAEGRLTRCLPFSSSGNSALDDELCRLLARTRWDPARDRAGSAVPVALRYVATWDRN